MKFKTITWFLKNPQFLSQAYHLLLRRISGKPDRYKEDQAIIWCEKQAITLIEVYDALKIQNYADNLAADHSRYFEFAHKAEETTPVKMGGRGGLEGLYNIIKSFGYTSILETGVAYGWSSLAILLAIKESNAKLISIDMPYVNMNNESFVGVVVHPDLHKQWTLIRKPDRNGIPEALNLYNGKFDLIHYDSDKSYVGRQWAYPILWDALKIGGIFISDDIQDNVGFKEFCEHRNLNPLIYESDNKYVGVVQKVGV